MSKKEELFTLEVEEIKRETAAAILIEVDEEEIWLPLSQIHSRKRTDEGNWKIVMGAWIAKQKGLL